MQMVKILTCEVFPEFIILSLDMESHSISTCLRIPNHNICDKSMLHINLRKLHVESKENLYSISVSIKHLHISPLVDSQTTRCFSR